MQSSCFHGSWDLLQLTKTVRVIVDSDDSVTNSKLVCIPNVYSRTLLKTV